MKTCRAHSVGPPTVFGSTATKAINAGHLRSTHDPGRREVLNE
jgi:hypothetical protein